MDIARNINESGLLTRGILQPAHRARGLQRRRRQGDEQVVAQSRARIQCEGQCQVRVQVTLVELIDDQGGHARQLRVALQASQRHARRHHLHARPLAHPRITAHRIADLAADLLAQQAGDPAGRGARGHATWLGDEHPAARARFRQRDRDRGRQQRRLTRARGSGHHRACPRTHRRRDIAQRARHRQLWRV